MGPWKVGRGKVGPEKTSPVKRSLAKTSLAGRITALTVVIAGIAVLVAGFVSVRLVITTARDVTRTTLANQADVVNDQIGETPRGRVVEILQGQGISVVRIGVGGALRGDAAAVQAVRDANRKSGVTGLWIVEVRDRFALVQRADYAGDTTRKLIRNIALALAFGLALAAVAGGLLGNLLSRPLRRTAGVAMAMSSGRRDLRAPEHGPVEVSDVAIAVNGLADALQHSEARQRDFLLSVSHELRTPLTAVIGFSESLADGVVTGSDVVEVGRTIHEESQRLDRLVTDLLDLARLGADDFRLDVADVDLVPVVRSAADVWHARCAAKGLKFTLEMPIHPVVVRTDARRIRQVMDGLLENAVRVTPTGRPVVLSLSSVLQVRDGGPGLSDEDYRIAFDRGALHAKYELSRPVGTGIGLALVHGLVTRLGGTITAGPAPEGGACFTVTLAPGV